MFWKKPQQSLWTTGEGKKILLPDNEHKVLVWNIFKASRPKISLDLATLSADSEFLLLQEIIKTNHNNWRQGIDQFHLQMAESFEFLHKPISTGVGIASTSHPLSSLALKAPNGDVVGLGPPKSTLISEFLINQQKVQLISTHLLNFVTTAVFIKHLEAIALELDRSKGPSLFAGDFNTWNRKRMDVLGSITRSLHYEKIEFENDQRWLKLDHAFVRGLDVPHAKILSDVKSSDHFPLLLTIK